MSHDEIKLSEIKILKTKKGKATVIIVNGDRYVLDPNGKTDRR